MPCGYHHLTRDERCQIHALKKSGESMRRIAAFLGVSPSTVSRELRRNRDQNGWRPVQAQRFAEDRRRAASSSPRKMSPTLWGQVEAKLEEGWSPEQISGRFALEKVVSVSATWIYRHVWADRAGGGTLYQRLRRRGKKRNRRGRDGSGRGVIPNRVDISERPAVVAEKRRAGDWEVDTIIGGGHRGALVSMVDRATKFTLLERVDRKTAAAVGNSLVLALGTLQPLVHTITADNGKEFAGHVAVAAALGAEFYFATPYHSWERGLNEHTNGLIRQFFPKQTDFRAVSSEEVQRVQDMLNARPRRVLGFQTPAEALQRAFARAATRRPLADHLLNLT